MKRLAVALGLVVLGLGHGAPIAADPGDPAARAVFTMICTREASSLGHRDEALRKYVEACVAAKLRVYERDTLDPTAQGPEAC